MSDKEKEAMLAAIFKTLPATSIKFVKEDGTVVEEYHKPAARKPFVWKP